MSKLVIVESPAKAKTIRKYLGSGYEVTASMGHIRDLPQSQLGIDVEKNYEPKYINIKGKEKVIRELKGLAKESDEVFLATDPDRGHQLAFGQAAWAGPGGPQPRHLRRNYEKGRAGGYGRAARH